MRIHRELAALALLSLAAAAVAAPAGVASAKENRYFSFEQTVEPWVASASVPVAGLSLERHTGENGCTDLQGNAYANLKLATKQGGGAAWMAARFTGSGEEFVSLEVSARNTGDCAQCTPIVYTGEAAPSELSAFRALTPGSAEPNNRPGWLPYRAQAPISTKDGIYVAVGWKFPADHLASGSEPIRNEFLLDAPNSVPASAYKMGSMGFDCLDVSIFPAP